MVRGGLSDAEVHHVIWAMTGFPAFWDIPRMGATPAECFQRQVRKAVDKMATRGFDAVANEYEDEMLRQMETAPDGE